MYYFYFTDSIGKKHQLNYQPRSYPNLMEFIRDQAYEDWGDCRGRAWCATCHIKVSNPKSLNLVDEEEAFRLSQLSNKSKASRLACQIALDESIHKLEFVFFGDD